MNIRGITFDLWDTLVHDDSDEPKRVARGLRGKADERRHLIWEALQRERPIAADAVHTACDVADAAFDKVWKEHHRTWPIRERLALILRGLRREPPPGWEAVIEAVGRMEVDVAPDLIDGCAATLAQLTRHYRLAVVSDAIVTPGRQLRRLLEAHGILEHFSAFAFSDEVGRSKPHRSMFASVLDQLSLRPEETVHIGDRDHNDVKGAQAMGMKAILFTATRAADAATTSADARCSGYSELSAILERFANMSCAS